MGPLKQVALDTSILVGLIDSRDIWHPAALALRDALKDAQAQLVHFDCVISEAINVLARRAKERKRSSEFTGRNVSRKPRSALGGIGGVKGHNM